MVCHAFHSLFLQLCAINHASVSLVIFELSFHNWQILAKPWGLILILVLFGCKRLIIKMRVDFILNGKLVHTTTYNMVYSMTFFHNLFSTLHLQIIITLDVQMDLFSV